jgi:hypothetical protein
MKLLCLPLCLVNQSSNLAEAMFDQVKKKTFVFLLLKSHLDAQQTGIQP